MLSLCTLLNVRDQVSQPCKTTQWDCACLFTKLDVPNPVTKQNESKREVSHKQCDSVHVLKNHTCIKVITFSYLSDSNEVIVFKTGNLTNLELLRLYNKHITPLASTEEPETVAPKTKSEKKASKKH